MNGYLVPELFYEIHMRTLDRQSMTPMFGSPGNHQWLGLCGVEHYMEPEQSYSGSLLLSRVRDFGAAHVCTLAGSRCRPAQPAQFYHHSEIYSYDDRCTDITIPSLHTYINVSLTLPPTHRIRPSVWCNLNLDSSVKIQCRSVGCPKYDDALAIGGGADDPLKSV